ncbi:MAG: hypothetical protein K0S29_1421, partial [Gammaproteobacteria bacterium]|nr:hypothetical protein [Gammaproteobacteria bacterium]
MWGIKKTLVIAGANGLIGRILYQTLKSSYKLILIDNKIGEDPYNRYGLERKHIDTEIPNDAIHKIDLSAEKLKFTEALRCYQPACVIHLAGLLENHEPHLIQEKNQLIHSNTLASCAELNIPVIAMSSIMLMYGAAMRNAKIRQVLAGNTDQSFLEQERLSVDHALQNNEVNIKSFNPDNFEKNLAYIKSKEYLESLVR